jgi:hypothetical protein
MRLVIRDRKGFIKLAVEQGADVVPVLGFGENSLRPDGRTSLSCGQLVVASHETILGLEITTFLWTQYPGMAMVFLPYQKPVNIVVGHPISVRQQNNPNPGYIDQLASSIHGGVTLDLK